jgi:enamine deaminase RidA (YjgF/YER057c/UK114 family)
MKPRFIDPPGLTPGATYSHGVRAGHLLFVGGQVALDAAGDLVGPGDIRAQAQQVFENLVRVLAAGGATVADLVRVDSYYVDADHRADILEVRRRFFGDHRPCSTSVVVKGLARPEWLLEVQAIAVVGSGAAGRRTKRRARPPARRRR